MHSVGDIFIPYIFKIFMKDIFDESLKFFFTVTLERGYVFNSQIDTEVECCYLINYGLPVSCPGLGSDARVVVLLDTN